MIIPLLIVITAAPIATAADVAGAAAITVFLFAASTVAASSAKIVDRKAVKKYLDMIENQRRRGQRRQHNKKNMLNALIKNLNRFFPEKINEGRDRRRQHDKQICDCCHYREYQMTIPN